MNRIILSLLTVCSLLVATTVLRAQSPTISSPTNGQVFYAGETVNIQWQSTRPGAWDHVNIMLQDLGNGVADWIAFDVPNNGNYLWTVSKDTTWYTNFNVSVSDGGNVVDDTAVSIIIANGTRPPPPPIPQPVPIQIRKLVSVEWTANTNDTYQVQESSDLQNWTTVAQGLAPSTNAAVYYYEDSTAQFFRVYDLSQ